ncbi:MAG: hypothetical protein EBU90_12950 [Proteobacteria bacterium]|nr:hypothetical protein [Pseudomonadota bacterium]
MTLIDLIKSIDSFFFSYTVSTEFLGIFRIAVCSLIIVDFLILRKDIISHMLPNGLFPYEEYLRISSSSKYGNISIFSLFKLYKSEVFSYISIVLFYVFAFSSLTGIYTNISLFLLFIIYTSIQNRAIPIWSTAGDLIIRLMILCLALTKCGAQLSFDSFLASGPKIFYAEGWPIRIIQVYVSYIYLTAAVAKSRDKLWVSGNGVKNSILNPCWGQRSWWSHALANSRLSKLMNYGIIFIQFFAPIFLWLSNTRIFYTLLLMGFHFGIMIFLRIGYFGPIFIIALLSFLDVIFK